MDFLPSRISDFDLLALLTEILAVRGDAADAASLRLRLIGRPLQALVDLAEAQAVLPPLIWALRRRALLLPAPRGRSAATDNPTAQLMLRYDSYLARRDRQRKQLLAAIGALNGAGVEPLLLKGARYLLAAPPDTWGEARDMRDIDLLIRPDDAGRSMAALLAEGYVAERDPPPQEQHLPELGHPGHPSVIELHTDSLAREAAHILPADQVWKHATRHQRDRCGCHLLSDEWHLLHCLLNHQVADRGHVRLSLAVAPLWEFAMLGRETSATGWDAIASHMASMGQGDILASWVAQASKLYGLDCPRAVVVSQQARRHADATLQRSGKSLTRRRPLLLIDQLRYGFSRETLGARYRVGEQQVGLMLRLRHLRFLARRYRGRMLARLFGSGVEH